MNKVLVDSIPSDGLSIKASLDDPWAVDAAAQALESDPLELDLSVRVVRRADVVRVSGRVSAACERVCERCGEGVHVRLADEPVDLTYVPADRGDEAHGSELGEGDLDVGWYEGGELLIEAALSEALALALPLRIVCEDTEACDERTKTLLAERGEAGERPLHPGLAALKNIG